MRLRFTSFEFAFPEMLEDLPSFVRVFQGGSQPGSIGRTNIKIFSRTQPSSHTPRTEEIRDLLLTRGCILVTDHSTTFPTIETRAKRTDVLMTLSLEEMVGPQGLAAYRLLSSAKNVRIEKMGGVVRVLQDVEYGPTVKKVTVKTNPDRFIMTTVLCRS